MQYQIPQFIEIEDQIFGSLTLKQFLYLVGGAGAAYVLYRFLNIIIAIPLIIVVLSFAAGLAFYKINNKPLIDIVEYATKYFFNSKLYIWKKNWNRETLKTETAAEIHTKKDNYSIPTLSQSKLKELSWSLDINEKLK